MSRSLTAVAAILTVAHGLGCGDAAGPELSLLLSPPTVDLDTTRIGTVLLQNIGTAPVTDVGLNAGPTLIAGSDVEVPTAFVGVGPAPIPELAPGDSSRLGLSVSVLAGTAPGLYEAAVFARVNGGEAAALSVRFRVSRTSGTAQPASVAIVDAPTSVRQGDAFTLSAVARTSAGAPIVASPTVWSVTGGSGAVDPGGRAVGYAIGSLTVEATSGTARDAATIAVTPRGLAGSFTVIGHGLVNDRYTSDLWVRGSVAYTGTWSCRSGSSGSVCGNTLYAWDVSNPSVPRLADSVQVDARTVNDVKISADGTLAVMTHEGSSDGQNGITLLSLSSPLSPVPITRHTEGLENGVHNTWIEDDYVYAVADGSSGGLRIIDVSDPGRPRNVASFHAGSSFLHDVYVRDGLAFLSHWNAGLVILDVGHGVAGGTPEAPAEVSRLATQGGQVHNAWYWPDGGYVFVGEEDFSTPGIVHVVDVSDLRAPREVATYRVAGTDPPHNFWLDEERALLYVAYYWEGLRAVDVSGVLLGELERQGREIASALTSGAERVWAPQLEAGRVFASDMNSGLWILLPPAVTR